MRAHIIFAAAVLCGFGAQPAMAQRLPFEKTLDAAGISMLDVSTLRGKIRIVVSEGNRVVVGGAATVRIGFAVPADAAQIAQRVAADPPIERSGNTLRLRPPSGATERRAVTVNYDVRVPPNMEIVAASDSGAISVEGAVGTLNVRTQSGAIDVSRLTRDVTVTTGSGDVDINGAAGPVTVTTSSSALSARDLAGPLRVRTGSGKVDATFAGGGDADVQTASSAIQLSGVRGAVTASTRSGHIAVDGRPQRAWAVTSGSGSLDINIASAPVALDISSRSGSVQVSGATVNGTISKRSVRGEIGTGGPAVRLATRSGSVKIIVNR